MSQDRCAIGHPGLMTLESGTTTVPVAALVFHEYFFDSILPASPRCTYPCAYLFRLHPCILFGRAFIV